DACVRSRALFRLIILLSPTLTLLLHSFVFLIIPRPPTSTLFPYTTLFRSPPSSTRTARRAMRVGCGIGHSTKMSRSIWSGSTNRSEEHTSELQSRENLVCRLLLEKKKENTTTSVQSRRRMPTKED